MSIVSGVVDFVQCVVLSVGDTRARRVLHLVMRVARLGLNRCGKDPLSMQGRAHARGIGIN
eukprot:1897797-Lingulodinium_polyedra.AAC.1